MARVPLFLGINKLALINKQASLLKTVAIFGTTV